MSDQTIRWLRGLAERGGKGVVGNIDARCLGRIAAEIERLQSALYAQEDVKLLYDEIKQLRAELAAVRHHLEAAYEAMGVPLIMSRPLSCYINDLRKELAAERAARVAVASPVREEGEL